MRPVQAHTLERKMLLGKGLGIDVPFSLSVEYKPSPKRSARRNRPSDVEEHMRVFCIEIEASLIGIALHRLSLFSICPLRSNDLLRLLINDYHTFTRKRG